MKRNQVTFEADPKAERRKVSYIVFCPAGVVFSLESVGTTSV